MMNTPGTTTKRAKDGRKRKMAGVHLLKNRKGELYGLVVATNGHVLMKTSESYKQKASLKKALTATGTILSSGLQWHDHTLSK